MKSLVPMAGGLLFGLSMLITAILCAASMKSAIEPGGPAGSTMYGTPAGGLFALFTILSLSGAIRSIEDRRRRRTADELLHSESRTRTILETAVDAIITIDERGTVETMNKAAERIFGYARSEIVGGNVNRLMTTADREAHDGYLARYRATGERTIIGVGREVICRRKDGTEFPADLAVGEFQVGAQRKFTGFLREISDRKHSESRIREQGTLLDKAREAIFVRDLKDRITYWNQGAARLFGWSSEEACGQDWRTLLSRESNSQLEIAGTAVLTGDEWSGELRKVDKHGRELVVESRWSLLRNDEQTPTAILIIDADITERKNRERQALRAQRLESIGTLSGGIAHDLNNMLTPILMSSKLLRKERPAAEREALLSNIQASAERGAEMVKQLLSFTGGLETQRERVDLRQIVLEIRSLLEHTLPKSIVIQTDVSDNLWPVSGDATQLSQVLMNLCVNARDAMSHGGVLSITAANSLLGEEVTAKNPEAVPGPHVVLTVTDTGSGIPAAVINRVFDPFFTTKDQGKGTGLGLSTVLGIVRSHGGIVRVTSEPGQGTRFSICLPTSESKPPRQSAIDRHPTTGGQGQLILIVDDEEFILVALKAMLEDAGYRVVAARDGGEAVAALARYRGDVRAAIVDMMMPGMDGPTTMRGLREIDPALRIIANSGLRVSDEDAEVVERCTRAFLQKPYTDDQLLSTLSQVLRDAS